MSHLFEESRDEAEAAIAGMRQAALRARALHAHAELLRHMRTTAEKARGRPRDEAVTFVVREWLNAWRLEGSGGPELEAAMLTFTGAVLAYVDEPDAGQDAKLRAATASLERCFEAQGTTLADQMAWRSECRHGWWGVVCPIPGEAQGRTATSPVPFWEIGCPERCC